MFPSQGNEMLVYIDVVISSNTPSRDPERNVIGEFLVETSCRLFRVEEQE